MSAPADSIGTEAGAVIDRLCEVSELRLLDGSRVEEALAAHLRGFSLQPRPVEWIEAPANDESPRVRARVGFLAAWDALGVRRPGEAVRRSPCHELLHGTGHGSGLLTDAEREEKGAGRRIRRAAEKAAGIVSETPRLHQSVVRLEGVGFGWASTAVRDAAHDRGLVELAGIADSRSAIQRSAGDVESELDVASPARAAVAAAGWLARAHVLEAAGTPAPAVRRLAEIYLPLLDALEGGLWLFWITPDAVLAVPAPESLRASARIERPRDGVWKAFTDLGGWAAWYRIGVGGPLERVEPGWQEGAVTHWHIGPPGTIAACVPGERVTLIGGMVRTPRTWTFSDLGDGATLLTYEAFEGFAPVPEAMVEHIKEYVEGLAS